jgi:hypothetical protein
MHSGRNRKTQDFIAGKRVNKCFKIMKWIEVRRGGFRLFAAALEQILAETPGGGGV